MISKEMEDEADVLGEAIVPENTIGNAEDENKKIFNICNKEQS